MSNMPSGYVKITTPGRYDIITTMLCVYDIITKIGHGNKLISVCS